LAEIGKDGELAGGIDASLEEMRKSQMRNADV
jgi:hypothetical protein